MLRLAIACLVIALIAALLGYGGLAGELVGVARIFFMIFLVLALVMGILGVVLRRKITP